MESTSQSSKVTVEYHDPSGIFPLVSRNIAARLPLRNLNWQSPPRPLRQIKSLHLDFVPDNDTRENLRPSSARPDSGEQNSLDIVRGGLDARKQAVKERRHQIPGFRTSPYLKIYILRCDDKDAYKDEARRKTREWIRENAQPEGKRDEHDAFEWLILHVVIPDTIAASEPRWRESPRDPDELKERKGNSKIIGKSSRTVFDRLRADFNESGKSGQDRVAQIRLPKDQVPADLLPTPAVAQTLEETQQERDNAWNHLMSKLKTLILGPFDRRVRQYEADIAAQEARRSLPGWNFCTFFIHKEGLAKALESIGLVEDALAIYDELSLGLETVLREIASGQAQGTATTFAAFTDDVEQRIAGLPGTRANGTNDEMTNEKRDAATLFSSDYRERIVMSTISVFDFLCYIFIRQKNLILRLANARSIRVQLGVDANKEGGEDLVLTSEICWRASSFIHTAARTLRQDLSTRAASTQKGPSDIEIEGLVSSWMWAVAGQVLEETAVPALLDITEPDGRASLDLSNGRVRRPTLTIGLGANPHPQRTTSLPASRVQATDVQRPRSEDRFALENAFKDLSSAGADSAKPIGIPGQAELATYRAELLSMRRKMLEHLGRQRGWYTGWAYAKYRRRDNFVDVSLEDKARDSVVGEDYGTPNLKQTLGPTLTGAMASKAAFWSLYERSTNSAIRHFYAATQSKSAETLLGDLAILEYQRSDYEGAASYFQHILPLLSNADWSVVEVEAMSIYSDCLKQLDRRQEFVESSLALLAKLVARKIDRQLPRMRWIQDCSTDGDTFDPQFTLSDVINASAELSHNVVQPLKSFFVDIQLDCEVVHDDDSDAFSLVLNLQHVLDEDVKFEEVSARLTAFNDSSLEVVLKTEGSVTLIKGPNKLTLRSTITSYGPFLVDRIVFHAKHISFVEELRPPPKPTPLGFTEIKPPTVTILEPEKPPAFAFLYPSAHALNAIVQRSPSIRLDKARGLEIILDAGRNQVESLQIRIKPISAGLRLHLADAKPSGIETDGNESAKPGQLSFRGLDKTTALVTIPYTVEHVNQDLAVRVEVQYRTSKETFVLLQSCRLTNELPLDVEVNDVFHHQTLFSDFTVRTTTPRPLTLFSAELKDSTTYAVEKPLVLPLPLTVHKSQPVSLAYKITRKEGVDKKITKREAALALRVSYQPLDELFLICLRKIFLKDLSAGPFARLHRLLLPILLERARQFISSADLDVAALLREAKLPSFETVSWQEVINTLDEDLHKELETWLRKWHADHTTISMTATDDQEGIQDLTISVDVPNMDMVFTANMELADVKPPARSRPPTLVLGQPVQARLQIKNTDKWSTKSLFSNVPTLKIQGEDEQKATLVCDIAANDSDTWIIGGQRRSHFAPVAGEDHTVNLVLVPLKLGTWHLPHVEIQQDLSDPETNYREADRSSMSCETHYENAAQLVQVIRDQRVSRVAIMESPASMALPPSRPGTASTKDAG